MQTLGAHQASTSTKVLIGKTNSKTKTLNDKTYILNLKKASVKYSEDLFKVKFCFIFF
jgi:hypothetical protein